MYVCLCKAITDRQVRHAVTSGAVSMRELRRQLDVCSGCGKCGSRVRQVFQQVLTETDAPAMGSAFPLAPLSTPA